MVSGQHDQYTDSIEALLETNIHDTLRGRYYIDLAEYYVEVDDWLPYNKKALDLADEKLKTAKGQIRNRFLKIKANAVANYGFYYDLIGQMEKSTDSYFKALEIYDEAGDEKGKAVIYSNLGVIYTNMGDIDEAIDYLEKALELKKKYGSKDIAINYINLGVAFEKKGDSLKGLEYQMKAYVAAKDIDDHLDMSTALNNMGSYYFRKREFDRAIPILAEAMKECQMANDVPGAAWIMANLGSAYLNVNKLDSARYFLFKAEEIADEYQYPYLYETVYEKLCDYYQYTGDWRNAFIMSRHVEAWRDSMENTSAQKEALKQKMEYDHGLETARMETKREEEKKRAKEQTIFILTVLGLVLIILIVIYSRFRSTKKQKRIIEDQKLLVEEKNTEILDSINYAKYLQGAILPDEKDIIQNFTDGFLLYMPKDIVAGDFYWHHHSNDYIYFAVADCTGHGVPGALVSVVCANALDKAVTDLNCPEPGPLLDNVREIVIKQFEGVNKDVKDGMDISLCRIDHQSGELLFAGANNPCWVHSGNGWNVIKGDRQPVGNYDHATPFATKSIHVEKGDWLFLLTDGIIDQFGGEDGKKLKSKGLQEWLSESNDLSGTDRQKHLVEKLNSWLEREEQIDDICILGIRL